METALVLESERGGEGERREDCEYGLGGLGRMVGNMNIEIRV